MNKVFDYEIDFYNWALHNAQLLRERRLSEIDVEHIAEELESMGKRDKRELISRLKILLAQLLKWQYQPGGRSTSWRGSIVEQRVQINDLVMENPGLRPQLLEAINIAYPVAVELAVKDTNIPTSHFPQIGPFSVDEILNEDFYPGS